MSLPGKRQDYFPTSLNLSTLGGHYQTKRKIRAASIINYQTTASRPKI